MRRMEFQNPNKFLTKITNNGEAERLEKLKPQL